MADTPGVPSATRSSPGPRAASAPRRKAFQHPGRIAVVVVALLVVVNLLIYLSNSAETSPGGRNPLPAEIEFVSPAPDSIVGPVETVAVDLADGLTGVLLIRQGGRYIEIPEDQVDRVQGLDQITFRPGPGKDISRFDAGQNDVAVLYWSQTRVGGRPEDPASYSWSFDVKA
jgi:hypothetical protein